MSLKRKYQEDYLNFGFTFQENNGYQLPQCVLCMKTLSNSSMKPYQLKQHLTTVHPEHSKNDRAFFKLKETGLKRVKLDSSGAFHQQAKSTVHASYAIALLVAKNKKPHTIGETLIKPCILECARIVLNKDAISKLEQISMSNDTIKSRIVDMSNNIKHQVITKIQESPMFTIQLDESTDVANLSQLMVFARYMNGPTIEEEFLFCKPLETTTKAEDVMAVVSTFFGEMNLSWKNIVGVCSDGAPAMLGSRSGFISLVKHKNPNVLGTHCFIHRQALASKTMPSSLSANLAIVIKVVNYIKSGASNTRLFRQICEGMDATHQCLLFHTQVRWLSKGNMLARVFELKEEVDTFLKMKCKTDLLTEFNKPEFVSHLAYLADIFEALNELNRKLQGRDTNIISHTDNINAFISKSKLWRRKIREGNTCSFHRLTDVLCNEPFSAQLQKDIMEHLDCLGREFTKYFPGINTEDPLIAMVRNPFKCVVETIPEDIQEEFLELVHDSFSKDEFQILSLSDFWAKMYSVYPIVSKQALKTIVPFSSTYLCESGFSSLLAIKTKA